MVDLELEQQARLAAVDGARRSAGDNLGQADAAGVPAVGELHADRVFAGVQEIGDVVRLVLDVLVVVGPLGGELMVADASAVDVQLVEAEGGDVDDGALSRVLILDHKRFAQQRRGERVQTGAPM